MVMKIINGIKNLIYWFPIIWNDRDWDSEFLTLIIIHKLEAMAKAFESDDAVTVDAQKCAIEMKQAIIFLKKTTNNYFEELAYDIHRKKYGDSEIVFENNKIHIVYPNDTSGETEGQRKKHLITVCEIAAERHQEALDYSFKTISENHVDWWD